MPLAWMILSSTQRCSSKRLTTGSPWGDRLDQSRPVPRCVDPATWAAAGAEPPVAITAPAAAAKGPVCKKARRSISFLRASRLINSVPAGHGSNDSNVLDLRLVRSLQGLDVDEPAVVVDIPDGDRVGGIIDPGFAIHAERFRQCISGELLGLRIEAQIVSAVKLARPHLAILVGLGRVERCVWSRQRIFVNAFFFDVELD